MKSFNGCWTCKLRRKKCGEERPVCTACVVLHITCHYGQEKPEWMDGGAQQEEMAGRLRREVKERAHYRRGEHATLVSEDHEPFVARLTEPVRSTDLAAPNTNSLELVSDMHNDGIGLRTGESTTPHQRRTHCTLLKNAGQFVIFEWSDTVLLTFYLEHLFPFLFPFYDPSLLEGGRAWILEIMISSPVVRQATLCQSSYFFSVARGTPNGDIHWETALKQSKDAFEVLRKSLQVIDGSNVTEHLHGAVRIMASIIQVQRFEIAALSFANCHTHLNAALALFRQLLSSCDDIESAVYGSSFNAVMSHLGPASLILPGQCLHIPSAEQAAFRFFSALLIFDDIIASTVLQRQPRLYQYHHNLLNSIDGAVPAIDLEMVVGCQNWALKQISDIAVLDEWKQQCVKHGNLNVMDLVHRATAIKDLLDVHLVRLENTPLHDLNKRSNLTDVFTANLRQESGRPVNQTSVATRIWAHAGLLYLFVVVSGWQPANVEVCYHVGRIVELLTSQISPPSLLRTLAWPFCVAGCLAQPEHESSLREMALALQPPSVFGVVHKALEIMENIWRNRNSAETTSRNFATCFRSQGDLVLLV